jgi:hypothetical protein
VCVYQGDIATGQDALAMTDYGSPDAIVTNPPYDTDNDRKLMHDLIVHFMHIAPSWILTHHDWAANKHAQPYLRHCTDIVAIRRVRWIKGSPSGGMENFCWYRFEYGHDSGPIFRTTGTASTKRARSCIRCGEPYRPERSSSRFCSNACRQAAYRERLSVTVA